MLNVNNACMDGELESEIAMVMQFAVATLATILLKYLHQSMHACILACHTYSHITMSDIYIYICMYVCMYSTRTSKAQFKYNN